MNRTRAERRHNDFKKAIRKRRIAKEIYWSLPSSTWEWYDNLHQYSKNKIHCSCPICTTKSKNKGKRRHLAKNYAPSFNPTARDLRRMDEMEYEIEEEID